MIQKWKKILVTQLTSRARSLWTENNWKQWTLLNTLALPSSKISTAKIQTRLAMATWVMVKRSKIWKRKNINFATKMKRILGAIHTAIECESWTRKSPRGAETFETKCFRHLHEISWREHKTNKTNSRSTGGTLGKRKEEKAVVGLTYVTIVYSRRYFKVPRKG